MKFRLIAGWVLLLTLLGTAQESASTITLSPPVESQMQVELELIRQHMEDALNAGDIDSVLEGVDETIVLTTLSGKTVRGRAALREYYEQLFSKPEAPVKEFKTAITVDNLTILAEGEGIHGDIGLVLGRSVDTISWSDGRVLTLEPSWSATMIRGDEGWKLTALQTSIDPYNNPILNREKRAHTYRIGFALLAGLGFGVLLGHWRRRSPT